MYKNICTDIDLWAHTHTQCHQNSHAYLIWNVLEQHGCNFDKYLSLSLSLSLSHTHTHTHTNTHTHTHTRMHTHTHTHKHTDIHKHTQTQTHTHTNTQTYTNKHKHTHTHTNTYTPVTSVSPYISLNSSKRLPSTMRAITCKTNHSDPMTD